MKQKLLEMVQVQTGAITALRVSKLGYFDGRVPKLSAQVTLATSGAGVVCHMYLELLCAYSLTVLK